MRPQGYITSGRLTKLRSSLDDRQLSIIRDVARLGLVSGAQLRRLHYPSGEAGARVARLHLAQLVDARVLLRLDRRVGGVRAGSDGFVYALDIAGRRILDPDRQRWWPKATPSRTFMAHALQRSELYSRLCERTRNTDVSLESFDGEPASWRRFAGPGGAPVTLKPDAYVSMRSGDFVDSYFVEVDCSTESLKRIAEKARLYARYFQSGREQATHGVFPLVLWVVPDESRQQKIVDRLSWLDARQWRLFAVRTTAGAVDFIIDGAVADHGAAS